MAIAALEVGGCFGNFRNYYLVNRVGMSVNRDDSINVKTDQVWFGARVRFDGRVGLLNAFRLGQAHS
jgi:HK97 family phage major capsid protein